MAKYYLGVDVGSKTLGLATSRGLIATGYGVYRFPENDFLQAAQYLAGLIRTEQFSDIIVGYPKNMNNTIGPRALMVSDFVNLLKPLLDATITIHLVDERLTTHQAHQIMLEANLSRQKRKQKKDSLAAQLILETYLHQK
ncbi:Holliday junction resolvase RuvX [Spiroplasma melliferum]|uniref:Holliday junction resolvase RuvX n=1 Tax=Spiroplasma melliferum TaxID=2134 RepID=UPI0002A6407E|nr:Holliday junction resolvase RuvX [Spiroplasma melliferum]ELL44618.1 Holliday junction resolvase-like protein [Spiroplasma melliferum IPMB4A]